MSYIPTAEKLASLGFAPEFGVYRHDLLGKQGIAYIDPRQDGLVRLYSNVGYSSGHIVLFYGSLPSEAFFDQLLAAIGWQVTITTAA